MMDKSSMRSKFFLQEPRMTGILQKGLFRFAIQMFSCCVVVSCIFTATVPGKVGDCSNEDMQSLLAFKSGLLDPAGRLASWNVSFSCCQWEGVSCDSRTGSVVALDLYNCSLSGTLRPAALFNLRAFEHLDISFNNFIGLTIPTEMGLLKNLKYLNLSTAGFEGTVPWQLGNLSNLTGLDLSSPPSMLTSPDLSWLANLTALTNLSLNGVDLSATSSSWGESVSRLSQLLNITMSNCGLTGSIPPSLQKLRYLETLHLDGNTFQSEFPTWLANMTNLIDLQMSNANLTGSLPFELSQMPRIGSISLGNNKLSANVSQIFQGQWKSLTFFQMPNNTLYGSIPSSIGNISSLALLQLHSNNLRGMIPESLGLLRSLTVLDLGYNKLTGPVPLSLGSLSKLTSISLTHNSLTGTISESHFRNLNNLNYLDLSSNKLAFKIASNWTPPFDLAVLLLSVCQIKGAFPPFLNTQRSMTTLDLSTNNLTGQIPSWVWNLPKLEKLALSHNQLKGPIPAQLYNLSSSLKQVDLRENRFHGSLPHPRSSVSGFPSALDLSVNNITGPVPSEICRMLHRSNFLSLAANKLEGQIPPCICEQAEYLEALDLSGNKLDGQLLSNFSNCSSMKVLNLAKNNLEGRIPVKLGELKKLQVLHINDNRLIGDVPSSLRNCKMLEILDLSGNNLSGKVPEWIADLSKLRLLVLRSNNLRGVIPIQICYLQNLQILDLAMNHLSGSIPPYLSNLSTLRNEDFAVSRPSALVYANYYKEELYLMVKGQEMAYKYILSSVALLDLSANNLSGHVPNDIGDLKGLQSVNLSHNQLTGYIPGVFVEMANLEALDISCNKLSGRIPETFASLNSLGYLNLSNNSLSGRIPDRLRFEASSFWGNPELCGHQVQRNCSDHTSYSAGGGEDENEVETMDWWESWKVGMGMGIAIGFGTVIGALALSRRLSRRFYQFVDSILNESFSPRVYCSPAGARRGFDL